jgi:4-hydroxy-tetrahydrodipicolinate synthase
MGRDTMIFAGLLHGAKAAIAATANVVPALVVSIYECFKQNDLQASLKAQEALAPLRLAFTWGTFPVVIKEALDLIGLEGGPSRAPVGPMTPAQRERLKNLLTELNLIQ